MWWWGKTCTCRLYCGKWVLRQSSGRSLFGPNWTKLNTGTASMDPGMIVWSKGMNIWCELGWHQVRFPNPLPCQSGNLTRWQWHPPFTRLSECAKGQYDHTQIQLWQTTQIRCLPAFVGILIISSDETFLARTVVCPQPNGMQNGKRWHCNQGDIYFSLLDTYRVFFFTGTPLKS